MATKSKSSSKSTVSNGLILRGFRKQNKLTQAQVGSVVGRTGKVVSKWETGVNNIPASIISILNKKYKLGLTTKTSSKSTKTTTTTSSVSSTRSYKTRVRRNSAKSVESKFVSYIKSTGSKVYDFASKYNMATAGVYRIINGVGEHYLSFTTLKKLAKDTDLNKLFK